ncbi:hypothetical protein H8959_006767 [Pygathrix nigripes]
MDGRGLETPKFSNSALALGEGTQGRNAGLPGRKPVVPRWPQDNTGCTVAGGEVVGSSWQAGVRGGGLPQTKKSLDSSAKTDSGRASSSKTRPNRGTHWPRSGVGWGGPSAFLPGRGGAGVGGGSATRGGPGGGARTVRPPVSSAPAARWPWGRAWAGGPGPRRVPRPGRRPAAGRRPTSAGCGSSARSSPRSASYGRSAPGSCCASCARREKEPAAPGLAAREGLGV